MSESNATLEAIKELNKNFNDRFDKSDLRITKLDSEIADRLRDLKQGGEATAKAVGDLGADIGKINNWRDNLDKEREAEKKEAKEREDSLYWCKVGAGVSTVLSVSLTTIKLVSWVMAPSVAPAINAIPNPM